MTDEAGTRAGGIARDIRLLTGVAVVVSAVLVVGSLLLALFGVPGMWPFTKGLTLGCVASTVNLRVLSAATAAMFQQQNGSALLGFLISFVILVCAAVFVLGQPAGFALGFAAGITMPGLVGLGYAAVDKRSRGPDDAG